RLAAKAEVRIDGDEAKVGATEQQAAVAAAAAAFEPSDDQEQHRGTDRRTLEQGNKQSGRKMEVDLVKAGRLGTSHYPVLGREPVDQGERIARDRGHAHHPPSHHGLQPTNFT
ncbi:hypothetical protein CRG98_040441, partial [Punica granatum]